MPTDFWKHCGHRCAVHLWHSWKQAWISMNKLLPVCAVRSRQFLKCWRGAAITAYLKKKAVLEVQHPSKHSFVQNKRQYLCQSQNLCCCYCVNLVNEETSTCVNTFTENRKLDVQKCFSGILRDKVSSNLQSGGHQLLFLRIWLTQQPLQKKTFAHICSGTIFLCALLSLFSVC